MQLYTLWLLHIWPKCVDFLRGRKTGVPGEKPSKHRRDQLRQLSSHETQVQAPTGLNFFSVVRGNALTACATRVPHYVPPMNVERKMSLNVWSQVIKEMSWKQYIYIAWIKKWYLTLWRHSFHMTISHMVVNQSEAIILLNKFRTFPRNTFQEMLSLPKFCAFHKTRFYFLKNEPSC